MRKKTDPVKTRILELLRQPENETAPALAKKLGISRQMAARHLVQLLRDGLVSKTGSTRGSSYSLLKEKISAPSAHSLTKIKTLKNLMEDRVFDEISADLNLKGLLNKNTYTIANYAFSEMLNNAIDHSRAKRAKILVKADSSMFWFSIRDAGIGIWHNVQKAFHLSSELDAIEHVFKGKQTTFPERHSGQGIFFTSRIADTFALRSDEYRVRVLNNKNDTAIGKERPLKGTLVEFSIKAKSRKNLSELFREYADDDYDFDKNRVRMKLSQYKELMSRSQARRLLAGCEKYKRLTFDFQGVKEIGQAYADEVFRVFCKAHPKIQVEYTNANETVEMMIQRALNAKKETKQKR
jgi:anti-sigma regulatory factor (Ser/Thr protein kinase)